MNCVVLMGRLTRNPETRYTQEGMCVARYTLAVDRRGKDKAADFISCIAFGKSGEFAEKYLAQGMRITIRGHIQTGSYTNKDGRKIYTTDVVADDQEFAQSRSEGQQENTPQAYTSQPAVPQEYDRMMQGNQQMSMVDSDGFMQIPEGIDEELPFN